jgi:hypothetical protein
MNDMKKEKTGIEKVKEDALIMSYKALGFSDEETKATLNKSLTLA